MEHQDLVTSSFISIFSEHGHEHKYFSLSEIISRKTIISQSLPHQM